VFSSELARAWRTAELLHEEAGWPRPQRWPELEPDRSPEEATGALARRAAKAVAVVGHDPHLSTLIAYLTAGRDDAFDVELKKGGAACIVFDGAPSASSGILRWLVTPRILRSL
jgi:phosphohistidine phosphatase